MRNLKRALSLAVASVMLLGMMVVGTGASYDDVTSEHNQEAIEVLQTVGIMTGDNEGNFNPDEYVTRNEMAVIMCNLLDYRVASYAGTTPFTDVPDWAEPYVAACYANGITGGTSDTTYSGDDSVTTVQAALMLMKALGYFQYSSDFKSGWEVATIAQGNRIDLFEDVDSEAREALTRSGVAQLVLNTLESGMVEPDDDTIKVDADGVSVEVGSVNYSYVTSQRDYAKAISTLRGVSATSISTQGYIVELGEKLYDGSLKKTEDITDAFGRPAVRWVYNVNEIGTYADEPIATYTAKVSKGDLWSLIGKSNVDLLDATPDNIGSTAEPIYANELKVFADGREIADGDIDKDEYFINNSSAAAGGAVVGSTTTSYNGKAGKGVLTEVYQDSDNNVTIAFINTYLLQANGDYSENRGTLAVSSVTYPGSVTTLYDEDFDLSSFQDEDYILVTASTTNGTTYTVESVAKADVVTGMVDAYSQTNNVTIDGTKYEYAEKIEATDSKPMEYTVGADATVVLDEYGYVLYVDDAALSVGQYVYINDVVSSTGFSKDYRADAYFADGTNATIEIDTLYTWNGTAYVKETAFAGITSSSKDSADTFNGWYSFSTNSDDEYTLRAIKGVTSSGLSSSGITYEAGKNVIDGEKTSFLYQKSTNTAKNNDVYGNSDTIFVVVDEDDDITVYTGIQNAPDIKVSSASGSTVKVAFMYEKDDTNKAASIVFVDASNGGVIDDQTSEDFLYVLNRETTYVDRANGEVIYTWNVILNGEVTTVDAKANSALEPYTLFDKIKVDGDGYYDASKFVDNTNKMATTYAYEGITSGADEFTYSGNVLSLGSAGTFIVTDDTQVTLVLKDCTTSSSNLGGTAAADAGMEQVMSDPDAKHEVFIETTGQYIDRLLNDRDVKTADVYSVVDEQGSQVAETLYIVISSVESL